MRYTVAARLAAILLVASLASGAAESGAELYQQRCARCHGKTGEGKATKKVPALKRTPLEMNSVAGHIMKGESSSKSKPPHKIGMAGINERQANSIAKYIRTFK